MFATPDAHDTDETDGSRPRLRAERLLDSRLPPGIGLGGRRLEGGGDGALHLFGLRGVELDVHVARLPALSGLHSFEGFRRVSVAFTPSGDACPSAVSQDPPVMRHPSERKFMLQWNTKLTFVVLVALLVALAAVVGNFSWVYTNFSW